MVAETRTHQAAALVELEKHCLECTLCNLRQSCRQVVFGEGDPCADLMLVGEGPGAQEDKEGRPFVGAAGKLLNKILHAIGLQRNQVYIANIVKCRPPGNRVPNREEVQSCLPYVEAQIAIIKPKIIVCLGSTALKALVNQDASITSWRGSWVEQGQIKIMPTFHPAALLRDESKKRPVWEDFKKVRAAYEALRKTG